MHSRDNNTYVLIMAGGVGSRFWPKSRNSFPKQFIDILGSGKSLLQLTYQRFLKVCAAENIYILTNEIYTDIIELQIGAQAKKNIIAEPCRRNTAPCIAYATFKIASLNPNANIIIAPSDHLILNEEAFISSLTEALDFATHHDALITLGITPTRPDTGYGYIKFESSGTKIYKVTEFLEKPSLDKATAFLKSGDYVWNAGIFIWNVKSILTAIEKHATQLFSIFNQADVYNTESETKFISDNYPLSNDISIDYAIMEKADNVYTITGDFGWSDLGTWASLHDVMEKDIDSNTFNGKASLLKDTQNCIIQLPSNKIAVVKGLSNFIVVDDGDVLLIYPKPLEQEIKKVSNSVVEQFGAEYQ